MSWPVAAIVALNLLFVAAGHPVVWAIRGYAGWREVLRLTGVAYLAGLALVALAIENLLVVGVPYSVWTVLATSAAIGGAGAVAGVALRRPPPRGGEERRREPLLALGVGAAAIVAVYLVALARVAPHLGVWEPDAWTFWTPKAQAIYYFGGLDHRVFTTLPGPTYPLVLPALEAMDFAFMGRVDTLALHVQPYLLFCGFLWTAAGLLRPRLPLSAIWPFLALLCMTPNVHYTVLSPLADFPLGYFFAAGGLALALWLQTRERPFLLLSGLWLAAAMSTKREGLLLAVALAVAAALASARRWRWTWPRLALLVAAAFATTVPWRIWWHVNSLTGELPTTGPTDWASSLGRVPSAFWLLLDRFTSPSLWLLLVPLVLVAGAVAVGLPAARGIGSLYLLTTLFALVGFTWVFWAYPDLPTTVTGESPAPRAVSSLVLFSAAIAPLLVERIQAALRRSTE
jgi:hypothetical protein